ncbi:MAG TPA: hypothetical protein VK469_09970 [Candidatus Kapabacteria bacterium]|nr:hypothetical protein [Candidatus Kapabacteria bacterium]
MNGNNQINQMVERFENFALDEKEYLVDIFTKELREEKRDKIYKRYLEAKKNRRNRNVKTGNFKDLLVDIVNTPEAGFHQNDLLSAFCVDKIRH